MVEYVSMAVRESLMASRKPGFSSDTFHPGENPMAYPLHTYSYLTIAEIRKPGQQYFEDGVVAFTDAKSQIAMQEELHVPYMGIEATRLHEIYHILRDKASLPQDEVQTNRDVAYNMGLSRFPFPSYS